MKPEDPSSWLKAQEERRRREREREKEPEIDEAEEQYRDWLKREEETREP